MSLQKTVFIIYLFYTSYYRISQTNLQQKIAKVGLSDKQAHAESILLRVSRIFWAMEQKKLRGA